MPPIAAVPFEPLSMNRLASTTELAGREFVLDLVDGGRFTVSLSEDQAAWSATGVAWEGAGTDPVDVVECAPGVFFIDIDFTEFVRGLEAVTVVLSERTGWAIVVHQERFHPEQTWSRGPEVRQDFQAARIEGAVQRGGAPAPTRELVGHRHLYRYSDHNLYEHIYLSSTTMCGHNVSTLGTPGRADCHPATYYGVGENLHLVGWREYDSAAAMLALLDLDGLTATGKVLHPETFLRSVNRPFGGPIIPAGAAPSYPDGLQPL